jgi:hypothetical protein
MKVHGSVNFPRYLARKGASISFPSENYLLPRLPVERGGGDPVFIVFDWGQKRGQILGNSRQQHVDISSK